MEELVTLDCLFIDGTKIEANANKYSFMWKKATDKFLAKLQEQIQIYFQEEITSLIHQAIKLDEEEPISSEQLLAFAQVLEEELRKLNQYIEETPVKGKDERKTQRRKLKKDLRKVKEDFSVRAEKYEKYQETFEGRNSFFKTDTDATCMRMKEDHMKMANSRLLIIFKSLLKTNLCFTMMSSQIRLTLKLFCHSLKPIHMT